MAHYNNLYLSLVRICSDLIDEVGSLNLSNAAFINYDAAPNVHEWPNQDVIGISGFSMQFDEHLVTVNAMFAVSTFNDENLFRHHKIVDTLISRVMPLTKHHVYSEPGDIVGWMVVTDGTNVRPMERMESRPLQYVFARFLTSFAYTIPNAS